MNSRNTGFLKSQQLLLTSLLSRNGARLLLDIILLITGFIIFFLLLFAFSPAANAKSRIKDIVSVQGIRDNMLIGYGLVVGLNGTGDKLNNSTFTEKSLQAFLERVGVNVSDAKLKAKNVAAVTITATLPPFARNGSRIDVTVSTLGDAKSLQGGMLVATPLIGADGSVYALAQGAIAIGGFEAGGSGSSISKGVPTTGYVASGAIVEKEIGFDLNSLSELNLALRNPDISTAKNIADTINSNLEFEIGEDIAEMLDPGTVSINVPEEYEDKVSQLLAKVEQLEIESDQSARIVIDEASGTIVMNENVRIDTVAIAQGNLVVKIKEETAVSQPGAFAPDGAATVVAPISTVSVSETGDKMAVMEKGASLRELVDGLNALGIGPRDLITILQTIKAAGALQAEIETR